MNTDKRSDANSEILVLLYNISTLYAKLESDWSIAALISQVFLYNGQCAYGNTQLITGAIWQLKMVITTTMSNKNGLK